jgi:hypothetical protein
MFNNNNKINNNNNNNNNNGPVKIGALGTIKKR